MSKTLIALLTAASLMTFGAATMAADAMAPAGDKPAAEAKMDKPAKKAKHHHHAKKKAKAAEEKKDDAAPAAK